MRIAFFKVNSVATDVRRVADDYQPQPGELMIEHDSELMPTPTSLSDPVQRLVRVCFGKTDGLAHDVRFVADGYVPKEGELVREQQSDELPAIDELSDVAAVAARDVEREVGVKRGAALRALDDQRLAAALKDLDAPQEVKVYAAALDADASGVSEQR